MRLSVGRFGAGLALVSLILGTGVGVGIEALGEAPAGAATTITVNDPVDSGTLAPGNCTAATEGDCTLRSAIDAFNNGTDGVTNVTIDLPDPSTLTPAQDFYNVDSNNQDLTIGSGAGNPNTLTITYTGTNVANGVILADEGTDPGTDINVFEVDGFTTAIISGVTIKDGDNTGGGGGGILNEGDLQLSNSTVTANTTTESGGGIAQEQSTLEESPAPAMTLTSDTISDNAATGGDGGGVYAAAGTVAISGGTIGGTGVIDGNSASDNGGGLALEQGQGTVTGVTIGGTSSAEGNTAIDGGGVYVAETDPSFSGDTISDNTADSGGGVFVESGTNTFTDETITGNTATDDQGGGVYTHGGTNTFTGGSISSNVADDDGEGGGVYIDDGTNSFSGQSVTDNQATDAAGEGGGFYVLQGTNTFTDETVNDNTATDDGEGGGFYIDDGNNTFSDNTVNGNQATGDGFGGGFYIDDGTNTFSGDTTDSNTAVEWGGGVYIDDGTNSFTDETIENNTAGVAATDNGSGGGIYVEDGTNTFTDATVNDNNAIWVSGDEAYGGGLFVSGETTVTFTGGSLDSNNAYGGGGFAIFSGTINVSQADISSNHVTEGAGGVLLEGGTASIAQSTISNNAVTEAIGITDFVGDGGGIVSGFCNPLTLTNDTIANNSATLLGGAYFGNGCNNPAEWQRPRHSSSTPSQGNSAGEGGGNINTDDESTLAMSESIVANGVSGGVEGDNCTFTDGGTIHSLGYNLIDDSTCGTPASTDIIGQNPQLGALGNNGGPTPDRTAGEREPRRRGHPLGDLHRHRGRHRPARGRPRGGDQRLVHHRLGRGGPDAAADLQPQRVPPGGRRGRDLRLRAELQRVAGQQPPQRAHRGPGQLARVPTATSWWAPTAGSSPWAGPTSTARLGAQSLPSPIAAIAAPTARDGLLAGGQERQDLQLRLGASAAGAVACLREPTSSAWRRTARAKGPGWSTSSATSTPRATPSMKAAWAASTSTPPIVGIAAAASGQGYVLVASDGGVFNYKMGFYGSVPGSLKAGQSLVAPIVGIAVTHSGNGYWEVGADGGVFNYGDAPFLGSIYTAIPGEKLNGPIVGIQHLGSVPPA